MPPDFQKTRNASRSVFTFSFLSAASSAFKAATRSGVRDSCRIGRSAPRGRTRGSPPTWLAGEMKVPK